jgi:hypothetical protein
MASVASRKSVPVPSSDWYSIVAFGSTLHAHTHLHCCVTDGVFSLTAVGTLHFHPAADLDAAALSGVLIEAAAALKSNDDLRPPRI